MDRRLVGLALAASLACSKKQAQPPALAAADGGQELPAGAEALPPEEEVKPVYSDFEGPSLPVAQDRVESQIRDLQQGYSMTYP